MKYGIVFLLVAGILTYYGASWEAGVGYCCGLR